MGTKRQLAQHVKRLAASAARKGPLADLFCGMGSVAAEHADGRHVITNDALAFTAVLARARFTGVLRGLAPSEVIEKLKPAFRAQARYLTAAYRAELATEAKVIDGTSAALLQHMGEVRHAANDSSFARRAAIARGKIDDAGGYQMACLYYAGGYYSQRQAIEIDAIRYSIAHTRGLKKYSDWLLAAWLSACSKVINSPGHTAQFLKPNSLAIASRIKSFWRRSVWEEFKLCLVDIEQVGKPAWRHENLVLVSDALTLLRGKRLAQAGVIYADPPYTKDQYSRFYHVYEALYEYSYPTVFGKGRSVAPEARFSTGFCLISQVEESFIQMFERVAALGAPLVLSYPTAGLLSDAGTSVETLAAGRMKIVKHESFAFDHSTMGGSKGKKTKLATENIYVCEPI
ncbi:DNA adenine methylase [Rhodanobacter sp. C01]|uniref:DNA adenine methylase n=1 Tax=Rhodanobacter sp. C01 TaxID=1945856 RepID=UPI001439D88E|nr:DNA adenine methylase [Rhodanobacter sp. C01]